MYGRPKLADVNECRYVTFCAKRGQSQSLPPCHDALRNHTMGADYQAAVWRHALDANPEVPSPEGHGWLITDDHVSSIGDGGSGPCCAKNPTQKNVPKTPPRKKPV